MQLAFDFWDILEVFCIIAFMYRGIQDILGKGKPRKKEQEEYEALHVISGVTLIFIGIAFFVRAFFSHIALLYTISLVAATICIFVYLICWFSYRGSRDDTDKKE